DQGYTGHKHIAEMDIIHMGGRIYDPTLGRFMQADPIVQAPLNSQNYNRYSYVLNNPMSYTDPSGFSFWSNITKPFKKLGRNIIRAAAKVFGANLVNFVGSVVSTYFGGPAGAGAWTYEFNRAMGVSSTGALRAGLTAFASTYALQQIGASDTWGTAGTIENISANAMVGGISAELQGGKFGHGFISAGFASMAKPAIYDKWGYSPENQVQRVMAAAVVGGTASVLSGGKFANGAMTGAFNQMYNGETYAARKWAEIQGFVNNVIDGAVSFGSDVWTAAEHAGKFYYYGGCSLLSSSASCTVNFNTVYDDAARIGSALYDYTHDSTTQTNVNRAIYGAYKYTAQYDPAQAYLTGRVATTVAASYYLSGGLSLLGYAGGALNASKTYGNALQVDHIIRKAVGF
ncbi:MAG: RHS repeat-associated core domain-containing protein, partial [Psychromonas sp.]|nr:RHS repeat-associated core domain-containing protein [Psychromonas sp.]